MISLVAAMAKNCETGKDRQMPRHLPADLAHFKKITLGKSQLLWGVKRCTNTKLSSINPDLMPMVVVAKTQKDFNQWVAEQRN